jgi:hypothetical protein
MTWLDFSEWTESKSNMRGEEGERRGWLEKEQKEIKNLLLP